MIKDECRIVTQMKFKIYHLQKPKQDSRPKHWKRMLAVEIKGPNSGFETIFDGFILLHSVVPNTYCSLYNLDVTPQTGF